ncbi:putative rna-dependent rna polymerase protein [Eutypa lata UCREL1]|uniref:RNA-dependent RNA polymerase n=1 Tax=Eutypa lata (strain UCR-EL1) TaxID=1287681 RepID=M7T4I7_EUTLA|nr:putative rna-dependent rna polymerase protein [Eutypa lata UCREL1]
MTLKSGASPKQGISCPISAGAIKKLLSQIRFPGPGTDASEFSPKELWTYIAANEKEIRQGILRKFPTRTQYFARVQFCEEDGQDLFFNSRVTLEKIWSRWAGAKGMLALDDTLQGMVMCIRPESMVKFDSPDKINLEICDMANKPIPLVLNRQMIKVLEDMGCSDEWFFQIQNRELTRLRKITAHVDNTAIFLKRQKVADQIRLSQFIRRLSKLDINYKHDKFLRSVVETVVLRELRLLKHKARIPVEKGVTLFGIMDEYGYLDEDDVFITFDNLPGTNYLDLDNRQVLLTRSPALHPGDIQIRRAVVPPEDHPLRSLSNCIAFSQKGARDLPSQLSGGDLDGDIFNIIWDDMAVTSCAREFAPADYHRVAPLDIGRTVKREDMTDFFVKFMATDQLGLIAVKHLILADQRPAGTVDQECQKLAELHSTAVDYSKTGIPVEESQLRKLGRTKYRPDFMAPAPPAELKNRNEICFDAPVLPATNNDEDDNTGPQYHYYASDKILGKLYRAVDERRIWKEDVQVPATHHGASVWDQLLLYINKECERLGGVDWELAIQEARGIRQAYDDAIWGATLTFSEHPSVPISEIEVFTGCIFNKSGTQTRRQRDKSTRLKDEFDRIAKWVESVIRKQKIASRVDRDDADDDDDHADTGATGLELSVACLNVGCVPNRIIGGSRTGDEFQSFKVVAASCVLRELDAAIKRQEIAAGASLMGGGYVGVNGRG